jgi:hypothetical protein
MDQLERFTRSYKDLNVPFVAESGSSHAQVMKRLNESLTRRL